MKIKISADSTCDLSEALRTRYNVSLTPLYIEKDGKNYRDGVDIFPKDIYEYVGSGQGICRTAAVNVADYAAFFSEQLKTHDAVVHITISSEMSSCYQNACTAAAELQNVFVVDSRNLSTGSGLLVLQAAERAAHGDKPADIAEALRALTEKVEASFVIDTLFYLQKGGRCSALTALGANILKLKPCIEVKNGAMGVGKKFRGKTADCIETYVRERLSNRDDIDRSRVFITHSGCPAETVRRVREVIDACCPFDEVLETVAGCTISNHCGPGTLGVLFIRK